MNVAANAVVGTSVPRIDALEKVTGSARFTDDLPFGSELLYGRVVRSTLPHARIKGIDLSKALGMPGVRAVVTGADTPGYIGLYLQDRHVFCTDRVRCVGDPVVGIVAASEEAAENAARVVRVDYEPLPSLFDPLLAAQPQAPLIHPDLGKYTIASFLLPEPGSNVSNHFRVRKGNVEEAFGQCDVVLEDVYRVPQIQHSPVEPHVAVARWDLSGEITLWASTQSPFTQRNLIAQAFGVSQGKVRVIGAYVGGGFGSKAGVTMEALAVAMAKKVPGRPVKLRLTREEEFFCTFVRQALVAKVKIGAKKDGRVLALQVEYYWDGGAYTEYGSNIARAAGYSSTGPYRIPNVKTDSYCCYTNNPVGGPMRGFGMPEIHWSIEQMMDRLAEELRFDPVQFRVMNCVKGGDEIVTGMTMHPVGLKDCIEQVAKAIEWGKKAPPSVAHKLRGKGIAIMWKAPAMPANAGSEAYLVFNEDATLNLALGGQELGQGAFTIAAQIAAESLGVPVDWVRVSRPVDTRYSPYEWQTVASRLTWSMGNAVRAAAMDAKKQILDLVAQHWGEDVADLDIRNGEVVSYRTERSLPLCKTVVYGLPLPDGGPLAGGPIMGRGKFMPSYVTDLDPETGQGPRAVVHYTTGAEAVELEVDTQTGHVDILRVAACFDVGKAINPELVRAQIEGGVVQGLSSVLFEALRLDRGVPRNPSFVDYRIASSLDAPRRIIGMFVEVPQDDGPWGARGVGEHTMVPAAPAVANALYDAVGVRFTEMPLTAERIYMALRKRQK
jgi:CO/xanthine dehydrogenase Mo-binding subunit